MNIGHVQGVQTVKETVVKEQNKKKALEEDVKVQGDKEVVFEKSSKEKTITDYSKDAKIKYAAEIAAVKEMNVALDKKMKDSFLQMALDSLGEQQTGIKVALEEILTTRSDEITDEMVEQAKKDVAEDGYFGVEATAKRMVDFAKALSGDNPEKADLLMDAFLDGFDKATEAWGDGLPEISQKTKERTIELFEEWKAGPDKDQKQTIPVKGQEKNDIKEETPI